MVLTSALFIYSWWSNQDKANKLPRDINPPTSLKPIADPECGIENCHGLEISCGPNIAEMCTLVYVAGDSCRQFASCAVIDGECQVLAEPEFEICKNCVEDCEKQFAEDPNKFFECESQCAGPSI